VHISQVTALVESEESILEVGLPQIGPVQEAIGKHVADMIEDGSTLQIGYGGIPDAVVMQLTSKHDLGIHTELLPGGVTDLVKRGVVTGNYKEVHPGKVVASLTVALPPEELAEINGDPTYELYDFNHTDDMRVLLQFEKFVAVNNALFVDLTGNVCSETWGALPYTGSGGQATFAYAAHVTHRHSVIVLPSSQLVNDERQPRIMATLPEGSTITSHRAFVDYVVTEQGIAKLSGKSIRERIAELISVAHPDFRADLRKEAAKIYNIQV
jgi:acyl-CoA hydrolase